MYLSLPLPLSPPFSLGMSFSTSCTTASCSPLRCRWSVCVCRRWPSSMGSAARRSVPSSTPSTSWACWTEYVHHYPTLFPLVFLFTFYSSYFLTLWPFLLIKKNIYSTYYGYFYMYYYYAQHNISLSCVFSVRTDWSETESFSSSTNSSSTRSANPGYLAHISHLAHFSQLAIISRRPTIRNMGRISQLATSCQQPS